jgi:hypothetical protein
MISYQLAKELSDAGFPQAGRGEWVGPADKLVWRRGDRLYSPTLSELIAACGEKIEALTHELSPAGNEWVATAFGSLHARGKIPEEAVARLWLALIKPVVR